MKVSLNIKGRVTSKLGNGTWGPYRDNIAVTTAGTALACGLAALDSKSNAMFHAIGVGRGQWDASTPNPAKDDTVLVEEIFRKVPTSINYITEYTGFHDPSSPDEQDELDDAIFATIGSALLVGRTIEILSGTNAGDVREILSLSGNKITVDANFTTVPDATTEFRVGVVSTTPTNVVDVETTFLADEDSSDGQIREQGLFLGEASTELDSGTLMNYIRHPVLTKAGADLTNIWRLTIEVV